MTRLVFECEKPFLKPNDHLLPPSIPFLPIFMENRLSHNKNSSDKFWTNQICNFLKKFWDKVVFQKPLLGNSFFSFELCSFKNTFFKFLLTMFFKIICRSSKKSTSSWPLGQFFHPLTLPVSPNAFSMDRQKRTAKSEFFKRWIIFFRNFCPTDVCPTNICPTDVCPTWHLSHPTKSLDVLRNLDGKYAKINLLLNQDWDELSRNDNISRSHQTSWSHWDFWALTLISRQNQEVSISIEISQLLRQTFWKCQDVLDCRDNFLTMSRSRVPIAYKYLWIW